MIYSAALFQGDGSSHNSLFLTAFQFGVCFWNRGRVARDRNTARLKRCMQMMLGISITEHNSFTKAAHPALVEFIWRLNIT